MAEWGGKGGDGRLRIGGLGIGRLRIGGLRTGGGGRDAGDTEGTIDGGIVVEEGRRNLIGNLSSHGDGGLTHFLRGSKNIEEDRVGNSQTLGGNLQTCGVGDSSCMHPGITTKGSRFADRKASVGSAESKKIEIAKGVFVRIEKDDRGCGHTYSGNTLIHALSHAKKGLDISVLESSPIAVYDSSCKFANSSLGCDGKVTDENVGDTMSRTECESVHLD